MVNFNIHIKYSMPLNSIFAIKWWFSEITITTSTRRLGIDVAVFDWNIPWIKSIKWSMMQWQLFQGYLEISRKISVQKSPAEMSMMDDIYQDSLRCGRSEEKDKTVVKRKNGQLLLKSCLTNANMWCEWFTIQRIRFSEYWQP